MSRARTLVAGALLLAGLGAVGEGLWIHLKARLAQGLTLWAWQRTLAGEERARPWPWADTWPVARLAAPEQGIDLLVLSGTSGRSLAFGLGHLNGTPPPGAEGNSVVAGHRDTHFRFLRRLAPGDDLSVVTTSGAERRYRVAAALHRRRRPRSPRPDRAHPPDPGHLLPLRGPGARRAASLRGDGGGDR